MQNCPKTCVQGVLRICYVRTNAILDKSGSTRYAYFSFFRVQETLEV